MKLLRARQEARKALLQVNADENDGQQALPRSWAAFHTPWALS